MYKKALLLLGIILPISLIALTLSDCVEMAKKNNKELKSAAAEISIADAQYNDIRGSLFPQISAEGGYYLSKTTTPKSSRASGESLESKLSAHTPLSATQEIIQKHVDESFGQFVPDEEIEEANLSGRIKLDQVIFLGGKLINGIRVARRFKNIQEHKYTLKEKDIVYETKDLFYKTLLAQQAFEINTQALEIARQHYSRVSNMYTQGFVSEYDRLRAELELARLEPDVEQAKNNYELARESMARYLGINSIELSLEGDIEPVASDSTSYETAIFHAYAHRQEIELADISKNIREVALLVEKMNFLPSIALSAEYNIYNKTADYNIKNDDFGDMYKFGIGFSIPLFTGLSNHYKKKEARSALRRAEYDLADLKELIKLDIKSSYLMLEHSNKVMQSRQKNLQLAQKGLSIAQARYEHNTGIQLEVFDAQLQLKIAKLQYLNSVYSGIMANEKYLKAMGK